MKSAILVPCRSPNARPRRIPDLMRCGILVVCCAAAFCAEEANLVPNSGFEERLKGWRPNAGPGASSAVLTKPASGKFCLEIRGNGGRAGMTPGDLVLKEPPPNLIEVSFRGRREGGEAGARVGLTLGITFASGGETWHCPTTSLLQPGDTEWQTRRFRYAAPDGESLAAVRPVLINYQNTGTAWFDNVTVTSMRFEADSAEAVVVPAPNVDLAAATELVIRLEDAGIPAAICPAVGRLSEFPLVIVPKWWDDDDLYYHVRLCHFRGGRVLIGGGETELLRKALTYLFWPDEAAGAEGRTTVSPDGRAAWVPGGLLDGRADVPGLARRLLATEEKEPAIPRALDFGPKQKAQVHDGCLLLGDKPLLLRGPGAYYVREDTPLDEHERNLALFEECAFNGLIAYVSYELPLELIAGFLDVAKRHGMHVILWQQGVPQRGQSEKPLRREWLARLTALRAHPALLGWEVADDTFDRHFAFVGPSAELLRRADPYNLITTTLMDPRHPERVPAKHWARWKQALDFPLTYLYPLQKGAPTYPHKGDLEGGFGDVVLLSQNAKQVFGDDAYVAQWIQAHMQGPAYPATGLTIRETYVPTCWQQRLLAYLALIGGTKAQFYFNARSLTEEMGGENRLRELSLVWHELMPAEDLLAGGTYRALELGDDEVRGCAYVLGDEAVILLAKDRRHYNRYVSDGTAGPLGVPLPNGIPAGTTVTLLSPESARQLEVTTEGVVSVTPFDLTAVILVSPHPARHTRAREQLQAWAPKAADLARSILRDDWRQTAAVARLIEPALEEAAKVRLRGAEAESQKALTGQEPMATFIACRAAGRTLREFRAACLAAAEAYAREHPQPPDVLYSANVYYSLPVFYNRVGLLAKYSAGDLRKAIDGS